MEPAYRSQARCFIPAQTNTVSLTSEEGNVPNSPLLPTSNADFQDSLLGILEGADTRMTVAAEIEGRDSTWLEKNVEFGVDRFNRITISAFDPDPKIALQMAQQYLLAFKNKLDSTTKDQASGRRDTFSQGIETAITDLAALQEDRLNFMRENGAVDFEAELAEVGARQTTLEASVANLNTSIATAAEQKVELAKQIDARPDRIESASTEVNNPAAEQLQRNLIEANRELAVLRLTATDEHPTVKAKLEDIAVIVAELEKEDARIIGTTTTTPDSLVNDLAGQLIDLELREAGFIKEKELTEVELENVKARRLELSLLQAELDAKDSEIRTVRANLANYRERKAELEVYLTRNSTFLVIPEQPVEATSPYFPIMWVNLLVAAILGVTVGVGLVIVITNIRSYREAALW